MRVTVLGASPVRPNPGRACSGYLLEAEGRRYLVDCGAGVLARLLCHADLAAIDAVVISHAHPDHCLDLVNVRQALAHAPGPRRPDPLPVYVGAAAHATIVRLGAAFADPSTAFWEPWIDFRVFDGTTTLTLDGVQAHVAPVRHYVPCWAIRFEHQDRVWVYTADSGPSDALTLLAAGAHLVIGESTLPDRRGHEGAWGHMSAAEAAELAVAAGAERLVLTHYYAELAPALLASAQQHAGGRPVDLAREGEVHVV